MCMSCNWEPLDWDLCIGDKNVFVWFVFNLWYFDFCMLVHSSNLVVEIFTCDDCFYIRIYDTTSVEEDAHRWEKRSILLNVWNNI